MIGQTACNQPSTSSSKRVRAVTPIDELLTDENKNKKTKKTKKKEKEETKKTKKKEKKECSICTESKMKDEYIRFEWLMLSTVGTCKDCTQFEKKQKKEQKKLENERKLKLQKEQTKLENERKQKLQEEQKKLLKENEATELVENLSVEQHRVFDVLSLYWDTRKQKPMKDTPTAKFTTLFNTALITKL